VGTEWETPMVAQKEARPLDRFPVIRTSDVGEMRAAISQYYGDVRLSVAGNFNGFHGHVDETAEI
jgi:hypothetical protein